MRYETRLPLHNGKAPRWLYSLMKELGEKIFSIMLDEFGEDELLRKITNPNWLQALACALGYDWHSSGTTTVTMAVIKECLNETREIYVAGGKGRAGIKTPEDIEKGTELLGISFERDKLVELSRIAAKVDSHLVYDNTNIYHHNFIFTRHKWGVVQQAMQGNYAIRFQWFSDFLRKDLTEEPHAGVYAEINKSTMDLTYEKNREIKELSVDIVKGSEVIEYPSRHWIDVKSDLGGRGIEALKRAHELDPKDYKDLLLVKGMGRKALKALALIASLMYGKELAYRNPVAFSYSFGGKDGVPFPVQRETYAQVIEDLRLLIDEANMEREKKLTVLKNLGEKI
ncbi:MAG: DUF763 domain-containing protein [Candidatus Micrarchaeaceae archaeon]